MRELAASSSGSVVTTTRGWYPADASAPLAIGRALVAHPASDTRRNVRGEHTEYGIRGKFMKLAGSVHEDGELLRLRLTHKVKEWSDAPPNGSYSLGGRAPGCRLQRDDRCQRACLPRDQRRWLARLR